MEGRLEAGIDARRRFSHVAARRRAMVGRRVPGGGP